MSAKACEAGLAQEQVLAAGENALQGAGDACADRRSAVATDSAARSDADGTGRGGAKTAAPVGEGAVRDAACDTAARDAARTANQYGRVSELRLTARARDGRTVVPETYCTQPFKIMHPFSVEVAELPGLRTTSPDAAGEPPRAGDPLPAQTLSAAEPAQLMVMTVSAGIMAGDRQRIDVSVEPGAALQMTTQSFEKIHRMDDGGDAERRTSLSVAPGAYLDYSPLPQIPFAGSSFSSVTEADLADETSQLVYGEILSCGRVARGERFAYRAYRNRVRICVDGRPVFIDNTVYEPGGMRFGGPIDMERLGFYEGFTHLANLVFVNIDISQERFVTIRDYLREQTGIIGASAAPVSALHGGEEVDLASSESVAGGITRLDSGDCAVKLLGHRAQRLQEILSEVRRMVG